MQQIFRGANVEWWKNQQHSAGDFYLKTYFCWGFCCVLFCFTKSNGHAGINENKLNQDDHVFYCKLDNHLNY